MKHTIWHKICDNQRDNRDLTVMKSKLTGRFLSFLTAMILTVVLVISCEKNDTSFPDPSTLPGGLKGTWLETTLRLDTILFNDNENKGNLFLEVHWEHNDFTAIYPYNISEDSIFIMDFTLSSSEPGKNYYFNFDEPKLTITIENFTYRLKVKDPILTFRKIK